MTAKLIGERELPRGERLRVELDRYRGHDLVSARRWYRDESGEWKPGRGLTVAVHLLPWLVAQLQAAETAALEAGRLAEEDFELAGREIPAELLRPAQEPAPGARRGGDDGGR